jgi:hypothetical protein
VRPARLPHGPIFTIINDLYNNNYELYINIINRRNIHNDTKDPKIKREIAREISRINHDRAKKLLFKILEENIEGWWD